MQFDSLAVPKKPGHWHLLVDLSRLRPGGENGGVKPFVFGYLLWLAQHEGKKLSITYLTGTGSHAEVRSLARPWDTLICVRHDEENAVGTVGDWRTREGLWLNPPAHLAVELGVDLVYSPLASPEFFCPGVPAIATVVDLLHRDYPMTLPPAETAYREQIFGEMVQYADAFQGISDFTLSRLQQHYGVSRDRAFRSYIAIHHRLDTTESERHNPPSRHPRPYFFYPANAWPHKNHLTLLVAYRLYREQAGPDAWDLLLTGHDTPAMREVVATSATLGVEDHVRYFGHVDDEQFRRIWRSAGALVFPSMHEGFGIPIVEAMHLGVPVVCSSETSLPEVAGDAALLVDARKPTELASALGRVSQDAGLRATLVARGREQLTRFSMEAEGGVFLGECRRLMSVASRLYNRGVHSDGWTDPIACLALPPGSERASLELRVAPMPVARRLSIYHGRTPLGGFSLAAGTPYQLCLNLPAVRKPLLLHTVDASNLQPSQSRIVGVLLAEVTVVQSGHRISIFPLQRP